jgi:hypothetical protein
MTLIMFASVAHASVLTFTANNVTVHYGDDVPPLTWTNSGFAGTDTWSNAITSGYPSCTTTYTSSSAVGTYPITCSAGSLVVNGFYTFSFVSGTITVEAATGMGAATVAVPLQPSGMMQNMTVANPSCSALVGDGATDNTAAFNCFLSTGRGTSCITYGNHPKQFYLPSGVYLVSGALSFCGSAIAITGDGWNKSIVKLASASSGFSGTTVVPLVHFVGGVASGSNNNGFNEHFENIGVEIGPGNPSSRGVEFIGNNFDAVRNVKVWFDDSQGESAFNLDSALPGQTLFKNIAGYGGSYCFKATLESEYNAVIYNLTCENQTTAGVITGVYNLESSNYFSVNSVPAWTNVSGAEVLLGAELIGGGSANTAITNGSNGTFYTRNITPAGYLHTMTDANGATTNDGVITEHWSGTAQSLFSSGTPTGIIIPNPPETPLASDPAPSTWCALGPDPTTWTGTLASCPGTTAYVPVSCNYPGNTTDCSQIATQTGYYTPTTTGIINVTVPGNINHIMGNNYTTTGATINWVIGGSSSNPPIILDHFNSTVDEPTVSHTSSRTLVFEDSGLNYNCSTGAGNVFFEDAQISLTSFCTGQSIYARGLDDEVEGQILAVEDVGYVSATHTLTLTLNVDPGMTVGSYIYLVSIKPATWLSSTPALVTGISGSTVTATWYGTQADYPPTAQTAGNYRVQFDKVTGTEINLWALGWKSEKASTDLNIIGGNVEIDGFFQYPIRSSPPGWAGFKFTDTNYFITGQSFFGGGSQRQYFATETRSGATLSLNNPAYGTSDSANLNMLYSTGSSGPTSAASPMFSPVAGTYPTTQTVTMSTTTASATIYYTTNGTTPTTSSTVYSSPITVSSTETVKAIAAASGLANSFVSSAAYTIGTMAATPTFSPAGGTYPSAQMVSINTTTPSAIIYYTTNGATPTTSSAVYSSPITASSTETIKAIAAASGYSISAVGSATYTTPSASSYPVTDAFSGSGALSANWTNTTASGYVSLAQASGTVVPSVSAKQGLAIYTSVPFTNDQYSQVKFLKTTSNTDSTGPCVHMNAAVDGVCWIADSARIYRLTSGRRR